MLRNECAIPATELLPSTLNEPWRSVDWPLSIGVQNLGPLGTALAGRPVHLGPSRWIGPPSDCSASSEPTTRRNSGTPLRAGTS